MKTVFVVGAGPAGLFAAQKIAQAGHQVIVLNRDIKPGGLAEYGIYPVKDKMKIGLRKQFAKVLSLPNLHYYGHVPVGSESAVTIDDLRQFNPAAMVFSVGAQGTKSLGLPGENAKGVYSAKDFVYFYNQLPPFASRDFSTGKRIAVIGMGNVAVDIIRWLLQDDPNRQTEEVVIIARRGPFEAKFDEKEFAHVQMHLDRKLFQQELERVKDKIATVGQDISKVAEATFPALVKYPNQELVMPRLRFRFLSSPKEIHAGSDGRINRLTVTENNLVAKDGGTAAKGTDQTADLDVDTMIFAIGDVHDPKLGLPCGRDGYVTRPNPEDPKVPVFECFDPQKNEVTPGVYVVGWARRASDGLVGIARHDGEVGAEKVLHYLESAPEGAPVSPQAVQRRLESKGVKVVTKEDIVLLGKVEEREAQKRGLVSFKFSDDESMLTAIEKEKSNACVSAD
jgi:ferredoxin--NADP+ reductase